MRNEKGSILVVTLAFVLVFTLLGLASIYFAGIQNEIANKRRDSAEAFWIADGLVEQIKNQIPITIDNKDQDVVPGDDSRKFDITTNQHLESGNLFNYKWDITAVATVNKQKRKILAVVDRFDIPEDPINSNTPITDLPPSIPPEHVNDQETITITEIIPTLREEVEAIGEFILVEQVAPDVVLQGTQDFVLVKVDSSPSVTIHTDNVTTTKLIVIDTTESSAFGNPQPTVNFVGNPIRAVLVVIGDANLVNPNIDGIVFIDGQATIAGNDSDVRLDPFAVDQALSTLGALPGEGNPKLVEWREF